MLVADAERRPLEDRQRHVESVADDARAARLRERLHDDLVDVHVRRPGQGEEDAVGDVVGHDRVDALVDRLRLLLVAAEADDGELGLDEARRRRS